MKNLSINPLDMRVREFLIRTCLFLPMVIFGVLFVLMLFGIGADLLGAESMFYCTIYCKICVGLLAASRISCCLLSGQSLLEKKVINTTILTC
jgi:hypothetical protein